MDIMDELNNLQQQKQVQTIKPRKYSYDEYINIINNRLKRINGELYMLSHELAQGITQDRINELQNVMHNFELEKIAELKEQLKTVYW